MLHRLETADLARMVDEYLVHRTDRRSRTDGCARAGPSRTVVLINFDLIASRGPCRMTVTIEVRGTTAVGRTSRLGCSQPASLRSRVELRSMALTIDIPGRPLLEIEHLVLDLNGTLTNRGGLIDGVAERLSRIERQLNLHALSADTFGTLDELASELHISARRISSGAEKRQFLQALGPSRCAAIGNGTNDVSMLSAAALGIAVIGPEGAGTAALTAADVVCRSILEALDLLLDERAMVATLRE
jgi:soluble P-type ATPase